MKKSTSGFTIVELVIVVVIIGILAAITLVVYNGAQGRARDADRRADIAALVKSLETYYSDNNTYPMPGSAGSTLGNGWYATTDTSWGTFTTALNGIITAMPTDTINSGTPSTAGKYGYAYYSGAGCGRTAGQWYLIVYRFENSPQEKFSDGGTGSCAAADGDTYYAGGASYYRSIK